MAERPTAPVIVTEGEKAADAAAALLPNMVAITSPNGSKSAGKAAKNGSKKGANEGAKGVKKGAEKTQQGADKLENKTQDDSQK